MAAGEDEPTDADEDETPLQEVVSGAVTALTLLVAFGLMFMEVGFFWVVFIVGFAGVLPMALGLVKLYERRRDREATRSPGAVRRDASTGGRDSDTEDALDALRERYARGELTEVEFERRVQKLLETESVEDARTFIDGGDANGVAVGDASASAGDVERDSELGLDREPELDREQE